MNLLDAALAVLLVTAVAGGWRLGFVARVASWIGALAGVFLVTKFLPDVLRQVGSGPAATRLLIIVGFILLGAAVGGALGEIVGHRLRRAVPPGPARLVDRTGGAFAGAAGML